MQGKVVAITGGTSGIGQVAAERLARLGARILLIARDRQRGAAALERLRAAGPGIDHRLHIADLLRLVEMKRVAGELAAVEERIDVLINNAGALFNRRRVTEDGLEYTFALNHMSYFVLSQMLRERLIAAAPSRIVNTASAAHFGATLEFDDLQSAGRYLGFRAYARSKLCNILFTRELSRRLQGTGVTANCLHPGFVATRFGDESGGVLGWAFKYFKLFAFSPEKGAETIIYLASSPEIAGANGAYFHQCRQMAPSREAQDGAAARRLWDESAKLAGLG